MDPHPSPGSGLHLVSWLLRDVVGCIRLHSLGNVAGMACGPLAPADPSAQQTHTKPGGRTWHPPSSLELENPLGWNQSHSLAVPQFPSCRVVRVCAGVQCCCWELPAQEHGKGAGSCLSSRILDLLPSGSLHPQQKPQRMTGGLHPQDIPSSSECATGSGPSGLSLVTDGFSTRKTFSKFTATSKTRRAQLLWDGC